MRSHIGPVVLAILAFWVCLSLAPAAQAQALSKRPPNIIFLLTDDQGYGDLSCHGNPVLKTPNLDKLHAESVRLTDFHVTPMCSPTRGQLMSGMDCLRNGAASVSAGRSMLRPGIPTLPEAFAAVLRCLQIADRDPPVRHAAVQAGLGEVGGQQRLGDVGRQPDPIQRQRGVTGQADPLQIDQRGRGLQPESLGQTVGELGGHVLHDEDTSLLSSG